MGPRDHENTFQLRRVSWAPFLMKKKPCILISTHFPLSFCFRNRWLQKPMFQAVITNRAIIKIQFFCCFLLILKQLIVSANLVFIVHREGTASEIYSTLAATNWNSMWARREDSRALTGGALRGDVSWRGKDWGEGLLSCYESSRKGAGSFVQKQQDNEERGKSTENMSLSWMTPGFLSILISFIYDPLNNIKEAKRMKLLFSGWTVCSLCMKKGSYAKIQQSYF